MLTVCVYCFALNGHGAFLDLAVKFIESYRRYPAGAAHQMLVVCNGAPVTPECEALFGAIPNCAFMSHNNDGYDIGAFQAAAREIPGDLILFFGGNSYIRGPGWLKRVIDAREKHGDTLYGSTANKGNAYVQPHIRTTGFAISGDLFNAYPHRITRAEQRYGFEHGTECLTCWIKSQGLTPWLVYWDRCLQEPNWDDGPGGFGQGSQYNVLFGDRLTRVPYAGDP